MRERETVVQGAPQFRRGEANSGPPAPIPEKSNLEEGRVQGAPAHEPAHDPRSSHRLGGAPPAVPRLPGDYTTELPSRYAQASVSRPAGFPKFQHRGSAVRLVAGKIMQPWPSMRCNPLLVRKTQFAGFRFFRRWNLALGRGKRGSGEETALRRIKTWGVVIC